VSDLQFPERKLLEEAFLESQERFKLVWEIAADAMVLSNPEGIVLTANPAYFKLYGFDPDEVIGHSFAIIFPPDQREQAVAQYKTIFADQAAPLEFESMIQRADGSKRIVETRIGFIALNGQRTAMLSIIRDITPRKQAEEALQQRNRELTLLLKEVNHRVKNNLAAIIGLLHLEQSHLQNSKQAIHDTILADLISRIHGLAAAHRLLSAAEWSAVSLSELTSKVVDSALQALPLNKRVSVDIAPSSILVSPKLANTLALIINELTTNTIKYAWANQDNGRIMVHITSEADLISLEYRDNGPGFPKDVLQTESYTVGVGWELIRTLVQQGLEGEIVMHNDHGAVTIIRFPQLYDEPQTG
jgi:PAS domain S-box-containing protein